MLTCTWLILAGDDTVGARPCPVRHSSLSTEARPIEAVLVMTDPDDWYRDAQLICDVVLSGGVPERRGPPPPGEVSLHRLVSDVVACSCVILLAYLPLGAPPASDYPVPTGTPPVQLYFSNPDLLWANDYPRNRQDASQTPSSLLLPIHLPVTYAC